METTLLRRFYHELLYPVHWARFFRESDEQRTMKMRHVQAVLSSPDYELIPLHPDTGKLKNRKLVMHNGMRVLPTAYYGYQFLARARKTKTVDEPQEERLFSDLLPMVNANSVMIELGSFWAFYSLWFHSVVPGAMNYMVEPEFKNLMYGKTNFEINGFYEQTSFTNAFVDSFSEDNRDVPTINVDDFCESNSIDKVAILHADIQGYESKMLDGASRMLANHAIDYLFISTHSNELHNECKAKLRGCGYVIVSDANLDEAYQADGVIFASLPGLPGCNIKPITKRGENAVVE